MQELCIVTVDIPFCSPQLKVDCIRKMKTKKLCSLSQNAGLSRILVTNFKHIYCEYDDIVISKLYRMMHEQPSIVSLDSRVMKTVAQTELFDEFSPMIHAAHWRMILLPKKISAVWACRKKAFKKNCFFDMLCNLNHTEFGTLHDTFENALSQFVTTVIDVKGFDINTFEERHCA